MWVKIAGLFTEIIFLCAVDNSSHIGALAELIQLLEDEDFLRVVRNASVKDILDYIKLKKFN